MSDKMKIALVGAGGMGRNHAASMSGSDRVQLAAVCDTLESSANSLSRQYGIPGYLDMGEMLSQEPCDGVLVATPHPHHLDAACQAFGAGKHVLVEKPLSVRISDAQAMIQAHRDAEATHGRIVFAAMFQQRTYGHWKKIKELIDTGVLGRLMRTTLIITDWFRTQAYYDSGGWRATWRSEGGGVLMNQAPHNLDLYQWFTGRPSRLTAVAGFGKYHRIEVEDEVSIILEHENGMIGHIISSTAESPGTNRLEIVGDKGSLVFEKGRLRHVRNDESVLKFIHSSEKQFVHVGHTEEDLSFLHHGEEGHRFIIDDFAESWQSGRDPIAPAAEGIGSLEIANAAIMSAVEQRPVDLPLDASAYDALLDRLREKGRPIVT